MFETEIIINLLMKNNIFNSFFFSKALFIKFVIASIILLITSLLYDEESINKLSIKLYTCSRVILFI